LPTRVLCTYLFSDIYDFLFTENGAGSGMGGGAWPPNNAGGGSLWGGFPSVYGSSDPATTAAASYTPVYPGMLPPHQFQQHHPLMKIGDCSVKPLGQ
jgi:hypothetical protein